MDFSTIERKLTSSNPTKPDLNPFNPRYNNPEEFAADVRLIVFNSCLFNGADHLISVMGKRMEDVMDKQLKHLPPATEVCCFVPLLSAFGIIDIFSIEA